MITDMVNLAQVGASDFYLQGRPQVMADDAKEDAVTVHLWNCLCAALRNSESWYPTSQIFVVDKKAELSLCSE